MAKGSPCAEWGNPFFPFVQGDLEWALLWLTMQSQQNVSSLAWIWDSEVQWAVTVELRRSSVVHSLGLPCVYLTLCISGIFSTSGWGALKWTVTIGGLMFATYLIWAIARCFTWGFSDLFSWRSLQYGIASLLGFLIIFFFKLVLAAGGKGMILNGLMCYKRHKEAASSTSYPAVVMSRGWESLGWPRITTHLSVADSWLLSEVISPIPIEFFFNVPPPPFPHLFQLL